MATIIERIVDPGGTGHYTSLAACEAGEQQNLVANNRWLSIFCKSSNGAKDTTPVIFAGYTTAEGYSISVNGQAVFDGPTAKWNPNYYTLSVTDADAIIVQQVGMWIHALQIEVTATTSTARNGINASSSSGDMCHVVGTKLKRLGSSANNRAGRGIYLNGSSRAYANIVEGWDYPTTTTAGIYHNVGTGAAAIIVNNLMLRCRYPYRITYGPGTLYFHNNIDQQCTYAGISSFGGTLYASHNCSDISGGALGTNGKIGSPVFIDAQNGDYQLHSIDTVARNAGVGVETFWAYDHLYRDRRYNNQHAWDIGPFEHISLDLSPQRAVHSHAAQNVVYVQMHNIAANDAFHAHLASNLAFTQLHWFAVQKALHGHFATEPNVNVSIEIYVDGGWHEHGADIVDYVYAKVFIGDKCVHTHAAKNVKFTQLHNIIINEALHAIADTGPLILNVYVTLVVSGAMHTHIVDPIVYVVESNLVIQPSIHLHWTTLVNTYTFREHIRTTKSLLAVSRSHVAINVTPTLYAENVTALYEATVIDTTH